LTNAYYTEFEYAIQATTDSIGTETYYFRVTNDGSDKYSTYTRYPTVTMAMPPVFVKQTHSRWRNDDGSQAAATWKAAEDEVSTRAKSSNLRLRFVVANTGGSSADNYQYLIEYATSIGGSWTHYQPVCRR